MQINKLDYAVIILTRERAGKQKTVKELRACGYTGEIILLLDDTDSQIDDYKKLTGVTVDVFNLREAQSSGVDVGDNFSGINTDDDFEPTHRIGRKGSVVFARNECWRVAKKHGYRYYIEMDDDYTSFQVRINDKKEYCASQIGRGIEDYFKASFDLLKATNITCLAWAQGGDFIGGKDSQKAKTTKPLRKVMNLYFMDTERQFYFPARMNDDLTASIAEGCKGNLMLMTTLLSCVQTVTQKNKGGLTDLYLEAGTYVKAMYSVMHIPSSVCVDEMGDTHLRLHHRVSWGNCVPMILPDSAKKK